VTDRAEAAEPDDPILAAAQFLARQPGAVERVLATHLRRADGGCTGCFGPLVRWPCTLAAIAVHAQGRHR